MTEVLLAIAWLLGSAIFSRLVLAWTQPSRRESLAAARTALFYAFLIAITFAVANRSLPPLDALISAMLLYLSAAWILPRRWPLLSIPALALCALGGLFFVLPLPIALFLYYASVQLRAPFLRSILHAVVMVGILVVALPAQVAHISSGAAPIHLRLAPRPVTLLLLLGTIGLAGLTLGALALVELAKTGGTPDPLDPPHALVQTGIYSRIRHPLQLAETMLVVAAAIYWQSGWVWLYAIAFGVLLCGLYSRVEEHALLSSFGESAAAYQARVPRFVPRLVGLGDESVHPPQPVHPERSAAKSKGEVNEICPSTRLRTSGFKMRLP